MKSWQRVLAASALVLALVGCTSPMEYKARFVEYRSLPDGSRAAVVTPLVSGGPSEGVIAETTLGDLKRDELVLVRDNGKDWDDPQYRPSAHIVERAER